MKVKIPFIAAVCLGLSTLFGAGCTHQPPQPPPSAPAAPRPKPPAPPAAPVERTSVIYLPSVVNGEQKVSAEKVTLPEDAPKYEPVNKVLEAQAGGKRFYPEGTHVSSVKDDGKGHLTLVLTDQIRNFTGGTSEEAAAVNALVLTLAESYPGTKSVRIVSDSGEMETLGGAADLTIPQIPDRTMVVIPK
ncbi:MAG: GerMN domain-containing protein [Armatimonadetes bacterium]|nr:GerMN domain-containing protein [Armatimonadota bacterium]